MSKNRTIPIGKQRDPGPKAPSHLSAPTRRWWQAVVEEFEFAEHDLRILTAAAEAWDRKESARKALKEKGETYTDRFGAPRVRPEVQIERDARTAFLRAMRELALDVDPPESRPARRRGTGA